MPVGLGSHETEIFFPLGRRAGLYGTYEDGLIRVVEAKPGNVATMNRMVAFSAMRHIYSTLDSFSIWMDGEIRTVQIKL